MVQGTVTYRPARPFTQFVTNMYMHMVGMETDESRISFFRTVAPCTYLLTYLGFFALCGALCPCPRRSLQPRSFLTDLAPYNFDLKVQFPIISRLLYNLWCILCLGRMFGVLSCLELVQCFTALCLDIFSHAVFLQIM